MQLVSQQQQQPSPLVQRRAPLADSSQQPQHVAPQVEVSLQPQHPAPLVEFSHQPQLPGHTSSETEVCVRGTDTSGRGADTECARGTDTNWDAANVLSDFLEMSKSRKVSKKRNKKEQPEEQPEKKISKKTKKKKTKKKRLMEKEAILKPAGKRLMEKTKAVEPMEKTKAVEPKSQPKIILTHEASRNNYRVRNLSDPSVSSVGIKYVPGNEKSRMEAHLEAQNLVKAWGGKLPG